MADLLTRIYGIAPHLAARDLRWVMTPILILSVSTRRRKSSSTFIIMTSWRDGQSTMTIISRWTWLAKVKLGMISPMLIIIRQGHWIHCVRQPTNKTKNFIARSEFFSWRPVRHTSKLHYYVSKIMHCTLLLQSLTLPQLHAYFLHEFARQTAKDCTTLNQKVYDGNLNNSFTFSCKSKNNCPEYLSPVTWHNIYPPVMFFMLEFSNIGISRRYSIS